MAQYEVTGSTPQGKTMKIVVDADSVRSARSKAKSQGLIPLKVVAGSGSGGASRLPARTPRPSKGRSSESSSSPIEAPAPKKSFIGSISGREIAEMTRQLAVLLKAHVPIVESLNALVDQIEGRKMKKVLMTIRQYVQEGLGLAEGFAVFPTHFNRIYINMVRAGESSGRLDVVLMRLADFYEAQEKQKGKVIGAMSYPILIMLVAFGALLLIFAKVIPTIKEIFEGQGATLPWSTEFLIAASGIVNSYFVHIILAVLGTALFLERFIATEAGRRKKDEFLLKAPVINKLVRALAVARFSRTLSTLLSSGVPMLEALETARNVVNQAVYEQAIDDARTEVQEGLGLAVALNHTGYFPPIMIHMIGVGEKTGELEPMLMNVAESYEMQVDTAISTVTNVLSPIMVVGMVIFVGFIMMAILGPIMEMNQMAG